MRIPVLAGPTASGKTALALALAETLDLEIISSDAMLVYKGMDIGTAKPSRVELASVPHHMIDVITPDVAYSVKDYAEQAELIIEDVLSRGKLPIVVGGTGYYIQALAKGLPTVPKPDMVVQQVYWDRFEADGIEPLHKELEDFSAEDAVRAQRNPRRVIRALEIIKRTAKAPKEFKNTLPKFQYQKFFLNPEPEALKERIRLRTEQMFEQGLLKEVKQLVALYPNRPTAMQAIGYKEVLSFFDGESTIDEIKEDINTGTIQYAKRQRTWFRRESRNEQDVEAMQESFSVNELLSRVSAMN